MIDDLTDSQIALLCAIGEYDLSKTTDEQKANLQALIARDFVEPTPNGMHFKPTAKGVDYLGQSGAGLNES